MKQKNKKGVKYLNRYNLSIISRFMFKSGWKSVFSWLILFIVFGTYKFPGVIVVSFIMFATMILKGAYLRIWKPYDVEEEINKDGSAE